MPQGEWGKKQLRRRTRKRVQDLRRWSTKSRPRSMPRSKGKSSLKENSLRISHQSQTCVRNRIQVRDLKTLRTTLPTSEPTLTLTFSTFRVKPSRYLNKAECQTSQLARLSLKMQISFKKLVKRMPLNLRQVLPEAKWQLTRREQWTNKTKRARWCILTTGSIKKS